MMTKKKRVITVVGTRPELIRLSCILPRLDDAFEHLFVYTGQNFTPELSTIFFSNLEIRQPDKWLGFDFQSVGEFTGKLFIELEKIVTEFKPDGAVILGDTNSCMAALLLERLQIKVFHLEAGNRCFNDETPEEFNRRVIDKASSYNLVYSEYARRNLLAEGFANETIYKIGSPMREVLNKWADKIEQSKILETLELGKGKYIPVSLHRQENVGKPEVIAELTAALNSLAEEHQLPVILSCHPRLETALKESDNLKGIRICKPFNFSDWCKLQKYSLATVSDSGSISEESAILGFNAITPRVSIERQEAIEAGSILRVNPDKESIINGIRLAISSTADPSQHCPQDYSIDYTSSRVLSVINNFI